MTMQDKVQLALFLDEYYKESTKTCEYDCCNCELGILEGHSYGHSCSIEIVMKNVVQELCP